VDAGQLDHRLPSGAVAGGRLHRHRESSGGLSGAAPC
jgi:hypothetical protein